MRAARQDEWEAWELFEKFERHSWAGAAPAWARLYSRGLRQPRNAELPQPLLVETDTCAEPTDHPCPQPRVGVPALQSPRMQPWGKGESPCSWTKRRPPLLVPPSQARPRTGRAVPVAAGWTAAPRPRSASPAAAGSAAALPPLAARGQRRTGERTGGGGGAAPRGGRSAAGGAGRGRRRRRRDFKSRLFGAGCRRRDRAKGVRAGGGRQAGTERGEGRLGERRAGRGAAGLRDPGLVGRSLLLGAFKKRKGGEGQEETLH